MEDLCKLGIFKLVVLLGFVVLHFMCVRQAKEMHAHWHYITMNLLLGASEECENGKKGINRCKWKQK